MEYRNYKTLCFLDTETTSKYWNSAAPIQIAAIITDAKGNIISSFNERIKTSHRIDPGASEVHGIYEKDLVHCRQEQPVLLDFCIWMQSYNVDVIITYNGEVFDRPMLNERCKILTVPFTVFDAKQFPGIDAKYVVQEAKRRDLHGLKSLGRKWRLSLVAEQLHFDTINAHDALADVVMLKNVWFTLDPEVNNKDWIKDTQQNLL